MTTPQDSIEGQIAIGSDGSFNWYVNGSWHSVTGIPSTVGNVPQDPVEGQIALGNDGSFHWYTNGVWYTAAWAVSGGTNFPQDGVKGQIAVSSIDNSFHWLTDDYSPPVEVVTPINYLNFAVIWVPEFNSFFATPSGFGSIGPGNIGMKSPNGTDWSFINIGADRSEGTYGESSLCYSPDLNLLISTFAGFGSTLNLYETSDGISWTGYTVLTETQPNDGFHAGLVNPCWSPELGIFCIGISSIGTDPSVATSPDGVNWAAHNTPWNGYSYNFGDFVDVCWSSPKRLFVAVGGGNHFGNIAPGAIHSPDGVIWTAASFPPLGCQCIIWSDVISKFVAGGWDSNGVGVIWLSSDGDTWTMASTYSSVPDQFFSIAESTDLGIIVTVAEILGDFPNEGSGYYSTDGDTWIESPTPTINTGMSIPNAVCWSQTKRFFCIVGNSTGIGSLISHDGIHWTS